MIKAAVEEIFSVYPEVEVRLTPTGFLLGKGGYAEYCPLAGWYVVAFLAHSEVSASAETFRRASYLLSLEVSYAEADGY